MAAPRPVASLLDFFTLDEDAPARLGLQPLALKRRWVEANLSRKLAQMSLDEAPAVSAHVEAALARLALCSPARKGRELVEIELFSSEGEEDVRGGPSLLRAVKRAAKAAALPPEQEPPPPSIPSSDLLRPGPRPPPPSSGFACRCGHVFELRRTRDLHARGCSAP